MHHIQSTPMFVIHIVKIVDVFCVCLPSMAIDSMCFRTLSRHRQNHFRCLHNHECRVRICYIGFKLHEIWIERNENTELVSLWSIEMFDLYVNTLVKATGIDEAEKIIICHCGQFLWYGSWRSLLLLLCNNCRCYRRIGHIDRICHLGIGLSLFGHKRNCLQNIIRCSLWYLLLLFRLTKDRKCRKKIEEKKNVVKWRSEQCCKAKYSPEIIHECCLRWT